MSQINSNVIHVFPDEMDFLPLDALRYGNERRLLACGQSGLFAQDEIAWGNDNAGRWRGPAPLRAVPSKLTFKGASVAREGRFEDEVARLPSSSTVIATWDVLNGANSPLSIGTFRVVFVNLQTKEILANMLTNGYWVNFGAVPDGSYCVFVHIENATRSFRLPTGYVRNNSRFKWGPGEEDYWDYERNLGKLPPASNASWVKRAALLDSNRQADNPEEAEFIIDDSTDGAEWSARLLVVGAGALGWAPDFIPPSGPSLFSLQSVNARTPLAVDPLARTGNVLRIKRDGALLLAGQRMTPTGIVTALWNYSEEVWHLLGTNLNPSTGMCECALSNHGPTEILERADGVIKVLTKCSKHRYNPSGHLPEDRLPGDPLASEGHPGGHSLRFYKNREYHTTENFGETNFTNPDGTKREQFYDYLVIQDGEQNRKGPGTVFHGTNDLCLFQNKMWGVMQDFANSDPNALQYVTTFDEGDWSFASSLTYPASLYRFQRLHNLQRGDANLLLVWGKSATSEERFLAISDGRKFDIGGFNYAIRRASSSIASQGTHNVCLMPARAVEGAGNNAQIAPDWLLVETTGKGNVAVGVCDGTGCDCFCFTLEYLHSVGVNELELAPFIVWFAEEQFWKPSSIQPDNRPFKTLTISNFRACYCGEDGPDTSVCNGIEYDLLTGQIRRVRVDPITREVLSSCDETPDAPTSGTEIVVLHYPAKDGKDYFALQVGDAGRAGILERYCENFKAIRVRVDSEDLPPEDAATYPQTLEFGLWEPLYAPATRSVEVHITLPPGTLPDDIAPNVFLRN